MIDRSNKRNINFVSENVGIVTADLNGMFGIHLAIEPFYIFSIFGTKLTKVFFFFLSDKITQFEACFVLYNHMTYVCVFVFS